MIRGLLTRQEDNTIKENQMQQCQKYDILGQYK